RVAAVAGAEEVEVGVDLGARDRRGVLDPLQPHEQPERWLGQGTQVELAEPAPGEWLHRPRALERVDLDQGVEYGQRRDPPGHGGGELETHRPADVMHHQMEPAESERVHGGGAKAAEPGPGVVEGGRAVGGPEGGQVERDPAQVTRGQFAQDFAVQETRGWHAVQAHHRLATRRASFPDEAADASGLKTPPGGAVLADHIVAVHLCNLLLIAAVALVVWWRDGSVSSPTWTSGNERPRLAPG